MLEDNPQLGELLIEHRERGKELFLGVHVGDARAGRAGDLAVEVEHHVVLFHLREDGEEFVIVADAGRGVGRHAWHSSTSRPEKEEWPSLPWGYTLTPVIPAAAASLIVSGVTDW